MELLIFGTCSGTEPMPNRHHTAFSVKCGERYYWFDAGEGCAYTAHMMGVDLLAVSEIFISHPHMDHVGGLANLLWTIRKLSVRGKTAPYYGDVTVHMSNDTSFRGTLTVLGETEGKYINSYRTLFHKITDSVIFENEDIKVEAMHNCHLPKKNDEWQSFSFRITAGEKRVIFSGDVKSVTELEPFLREGCDMLLMETGHHVAEEVCAYIKESGFAVGEITFLHHGRRILADYDGTLARCREIYEKTNIANDGDVYVI